MGRFGFWVFCVLFLGLVLIAGWCFVFVAFVRVVCFWRSGRFVSVLWGGCLVAFLGLAAAGS